MPPLIWPAELPQFVEAQGFRVQPGDGRLKSATDVGGGKVRRRDSNPPALVAAPLLLTLAQADRLELFWSDDTGGGVTPFWFPAPIQHGDAITDADGAPLVDALDGEPLTASAWWLCRFDPSQPPPAFEHYSGVTRRATLQLVRLAT